VAAGPFSLQPLSCVAAPRVAWRRTLGPRRVAGGDAVDAVVALLNVVDVVDIVEVTIDGSDGPHPLYAM